MATDPAPHPVESVQETQFTGPPLSPGSPHQPNAGQNSYGSLTSAQPCPSSATKAPRALGPDLLRAVLIVFQAVDHAALNAGAWQHGVAIESELDGQPVTHWNHAVGWIARMLTHLCAPGFMFLLGVGVVYFGRSRTKIGWSKERMARHFFVRGVVLTAVNQVLTLITGLGLLWLINIVLLALAVNYVLAGFLWLLLDWSEVKVAAVIEGILERGEARGGDGDGSDDAAVRSENEEEEQPLLAAAAGTVETASSVRRSKAKEVSFHMHNILLLAMVVVTIFGNVWLSRDGGHCLTSSESVNTISARVHLNIPPENPTLFEFLFYPVFSGYVQSIFPPLAWISFAVLGLLYGRLLLRYQRPAPVVSTATALTGVVFSLLLLLTRLTHIGNLSEGCLRMPENLAHPEKNQYFVGFRAFFYATKYPPSPAFMCYTMAVNMFLLAGFSLLPLLPATGGGDLSKEESWGTKVLRLVYAVLLPFGQCALFFYALHIPLYHLLGAIVKKIWGRPLGFPDALFGGEAVGVGYGFVFWTMYFLGLAIMWLACRQYSKFKGSKGPDSIWRFF